MSNTKEITFERLSQRGEKAVEIAENGCAVSFTEDDFAFVRSTVDGTRHYKVDMAGNRCSCPDWIFRHAKIEKDTGRKHSCKHLLAAKMVLVKKELAA